MLKPMLDTMAGYNAWANGRIYDAAAALPDDDYRADLGAFFRSVHGTLNHLLTGDYVWMHRFTGEGPAPTKLDMIHYEDLALLRQAREAEDARIMAYIEGLDETALAAPVTYRTISNPAEISQVLGSAVINFFNHQTHHRGQVHALLTRLAGEGPVLDLIQFQREAGLSTVRPV